MVPFDLLHVNNAQYTVCLSYVHAYRNGWTVGQTTNRYLLCVISSPINVPLQSLFDVCMPMLLTEHTNHLLSTNSNSNNSHTGRFTEQSSNICYHRLSTTLNSESVLPISCGAAQSVISWSACLKLVIRLPMISRISCYFHSSPHHTWTKIDNWISPCRVIRG